jgi:hypothetical protein
MEIIPILALALCMWRPTIIIKENERVLRGNNRLPNTDIPTGISNDDVDNTDTV